MRICWLPAATHPKLSSESEVQMFFTIIRNWLAMRDDLYFYVVLPSDAHFEDLNPPPKTKIVPLKDANFVFYDIHATIPNGFYDLFSQRVGTYPIDGLITGRTNATVLLQRQLWDFRLKGPVPVMIDEEMAVNPGAMPAPLQVSEIDMMCRSMAYASSWGIFDTRLERENALITARKYLSGSMLKRVAERSTVIAPGVDTAWVDENVGYNAPKNSKFSLFFGGRLNVAKRADQLIAVYDKMYAFGRDIRIVLCSPKDDGTFKHEYIKSKGRVEVELYNNLQPYEFYKKAASAHVYLASSKMEGFSIGFLEQIYMSKYGLVPILPDLPWCHTLLPIKGKYRLMYKNFTEAAAMIRWVYDNYEQAVKECSWLSDYVVDTYRADLVTKQYLDFVTERVTEYQEYKRLFTSGGVELIRECSDRLKGSFALDDLYAMMSKYSRIGKYEPVRGKMSKYIVYKWLTEVGGYRDTCTTPVPIFEKVREEMPYAYDTGSEIDTSGEDQAEFMESEYSD